MSNKADYFDILVDLARQEAVLYVVLTTGAK